MIMPRAVALALAAAALLSCSSPDDPMVADTGSSTSTRGGETSPDTTMGVPTGPAGIDGVLIDAAGQPIGEFQVLGCLIDTCYFGESALDGTFSFDIEPPAEVALKTHAVITQTPRLAAALEPIRIIDDTRIQAGTLYVPELPPGATLDPMIEGGQTLSVGDELELTVRHADLTPPPGVFLNDLAARRIPAEHVPPYPDLGGEEVVAVYVLHPFETTSASPIAVRAPADLPAGTTVRLRTIHHLDGIFSEPVSGTADGTVVTTDPGVGITLLTYLVISVP
jgi:hypothetical protein